MSWQSRFRLAVCLAAGLAAWVARPETAPGTARPAENLNGTYVREGSAAKVALSLKEESDGHLRGQLTAGAERYRVDAAPEQDPRSADFMHRSLFQALGVRVTLWKIIGYVATLIFAGRWLVQALASRKAGRPVMTRLFWLMSLTGSVMLLGYFIFGRNDSVGVLSNLFPSAVATYNLYLDVRYHRANGGGAAEPPPDKYLKV